MNKSLMFDFNGKTALVSGATRGIGFAIAQLLGDLGCKVIATGTSPDGLGPDNAAEYRPLDLSVDESVQKFCSDLETIDGLDILINNAGINKIEPVDEMTDDIWETILKVNLTGAMKLTRSAARVMKKKGQGGRILNISSIFGLASKEKRGSYSTSKFGMNGLTKAACLDLAKDKILVNSLCPGFTLTDLTKGILSEKDMDDLCAQVPLGRFADEEEIARTAVFLVSPWNTYITGETVVIDGGYLSR